MWPDKVPTGSLERVPWAKLSLCMHEDPRVQIFITLVNTDTWSTFAFPVFSRQRLQLKAELTDAKRKSGG